MALNEALARDVNELVDQRAAGWFDAGERVEFRCECSRTGCGEPVLLTREEYASVRESPTTFVIAPGHDAPEIEDVVGHIRDYPVVSKIGPGAGIAEVTDPRAA